MRRSLLAAGVAGGVLVGGAMPLMLLSITDAASAASGGCSVITITGPSGGELTLKPNPATAKVGQCVNFTNKTPVTVTVKVDGKTLSIGQNSANSSYSPAKAGSYPVAASEPGALGIGTVSGSDTLKVTSPSSPPTPSHSASSQPTHTTSGSSAPTTGPDVAPTSDKHHKKHGGAGGPSPTVSLPPLPPLSTVSPSSAPGANPLVAPGQVSPTDDPTTLLDSTSSSPLPTVKAAVVEHDDGPSKGLPAAVAGVLIAGVAFGLVRVARHRGRR